MVLENGVAIFEIPKRAIYWILALIMGGAEKKFSKIKNAVFWFFDPQNHSKSSQIGGGWFLDMFPDIS